MSFFKYVTILIFSLCSKFVTACETLPDRCNLDLIYDKENGYEYSLPRPLLESFLSGKAFDHQEFYSTEELHRIHDDINEIYHRIIFQNPLKAKRAKITAGAPGSGKTLKLHQDLEENGNAYAYICPDDVCLRNMSRTYQADINQGDGSKEVRQAAYNKWRPASNAASHLILANLIREHYAFYFGTTSTGPATAGFFNFLKKQGYQIRLIHISAPDEIRWQSIQERDKIFIQTTEQDIIAKGFLLPQRLQDTYLTYADEIEFYYREKVNEDAQIAAKWIRQSASPLYQGTLHIKNPSLYTKIKNLHNESIAKLKRFDLEWDLVIEKNSKIFEE